VKRTFPDPRWHDAIVAAARALEDTAAAIVEKYLAVTAGLPSTERLIEMDMVI
jgi:ABC-type metal ion transport system substrate-binding protein